MKEVECLCGEKVVFLDAEVQVKTCPNCGAPVYQYGVPRMFEERVRRKRSPLRSTQGLWVAGLLSVVLLAVIVVAVLSVARTQALARARLDEERADAARLRGDYSTAEEFYSRALDAYRRWGGESDAVAKVSAALEEVTAVLGGEVNMRTFTGNVVLTIPPGTQPGQTIRLAGQGMPQIKNPEQRGDLFARVKVNIPRRLSAEQRELFEQLKKLG